MDGICNKHGTDDRGTQDLNVETIRKTAWEAQANLTVKSVAQNLRTG